MNSSQQMRLLCVALSSLLMSTALAAEHPEKPTYPYEKCYGIAAAGKNDCFTAKNSCAATTEKDGEPQAWIYVPAGTCVKIVGGNLKPG